MCDTQEIEDPFCKPSSPVKLDFSEIQSAKEAIDGGVVRTPCNKSRLSDLCGINLYLKTEFMQYTGSFKERGARYALMKLSDQQKKAGAVSASSGNHAQAMSYHGFDLGIPITVVMPLTAPIMKVERCRQLQANVIVEGSNLAESKSIAMKLAKDKGALYVNGYDHPDILAGQGTIGLEILEQVPKMHAVVVPVGGGGLIAGVGVAIKTLKPCAKVIGVESEACPGFTNSLKAGKSVFTEVLPTLADGLAVPNVGVNSVETCKNCVDKMINVKEEDIAVGILRLIENEKFVVEGAGATSLAAALAGQLDDFKGKNVVLILSGGNIDTTVLGRCLERGMSSDGRLVKIYVTVSDRPGSAAELCGLICKAGATIKHIQQERAWITFDVFSVYAKVVCETRDYQHAQELEALLNEHYEKVDLVHAPFPASGQTNRPPPGASNRSRTSTTNQAAAQTNTTCKCSKK